MSQSSSDIQKAYDTASEAYAKTFLDELRHKPFDLALLQQFALSVGKGGMVLDLGCGPGHTTDHLHNMELSPVGVDLSPQMIAMATSLFPYLTFLVGDFFQLPQKELSASGVLAFYCIVHLRPDQLVPAFSEMFRVLKPGGTLLLSFHVGTGTIQTDSFLSTGASLEFSLFSVSDIQSALTTAGFIDLEIHQRPPYQIEHPTKRCYIFAQKP